MSNEKDRFDKVLAIAINPGAYEGEAIAALHKARELVKKDPSLAHPRPLPAPAPHPASPGDDALEIRVTHISQFWLNIFLNSLSSEAYGLGLKSKLVCDFGEAPHAVDIRCDGPKAGCDAFRAHLSWLIDHINSKPRNG